ncbi:hypothetical protein JCM11641_001361 [Rhodosporidiobolus odoratus]
MGLLRKLTRKSSPTRGPTTSSRSTSPSPAPSASFTSSSSGHGHSSTPLPATTATTPLSQTLPSSASTSADSPLSSLPPPPVPVPDGAYDIPYSQTPPTSDAVSTPKEKEVVVGRQAGTDDALARGNAEPIEVAGDSSSDSDYFDDADSGDEADFAAAEEILPAPSDKATLRIALGSTSGGPAAPPPYTAPTPARPRQEMSKAARLAAEKMEEEVKLRPKLGKPLSALTAQDVALGEEDIREDISVIWKALHLFLSSRMLEAEEILSTAKDHRLYYSVGFSLVQAIKSLATFEPADLEAAIQCSRESREIAQLLRKKDHGLFERVGSIAKGSTSVASVRAMSVVQRHAELVYAECTLLKAVLGIIYSGDFFAFLKEALNMRSAYAIYRTLAKYIEEADAAHGGGEDDPSIDQDFRSGVCLGNGMISLILSLLPGSVLKLSSVFGITGDRDSALALLMKPGGWEVGVKEPGTEPEKEGLRRTVCDMVLLMYHLVIASYIPTGAVDVPTASNILHYHLDRYPDGIFFLYFGGRLRTMETVLNEAKASYHRAIAAQSEFKQLGHICYWDLGLASLAQGDWTGGHEYFTILDKESNWSKAIYAYAKAVTLYEPGLSLAEVSSTMQTIPALLQRIGGKSIPVEKFISRRARKFVSQDNRLSLPGIEIAYVLNSLGTAPRSVLYEKHLKQVEAVLEELEATSAPKEYKNGGEEYWDDYALAHFLRGVIYRLIAHPEPHVKNDPEAPPVLPEQADEQALSSFNNILQHSKEIQHDHHLVYFAHYELGRLHHCRGEYDKAREHYDNVMGGRVVIEKKSKGKVSLQNMVVLRANSGLQVLKEEGH